MESVLWQHQHSQMWTPSLRVRYQSSPVSIPGNNQCEAITPLYLLLSSLPSSRMDDPGIKTDGWCVFCPCVSGYYVVRCLIVASACSLCRLLCMQTYLRMQGWVIVWAFVAAADRSSNTDRMQAVPMRLCMPTAAVHKEQLLMRLQYKELTQCLPPSLYLL